MRAKGHNLLVCVLYHKFFPMFKIFIDIIHMDGDDQAGNTGVIC